MTFESVADIFDELEPDTQQLWAYDLRAALLSPNSVCSPTSEKALISPRRKDLSPQSRLVLDRFDTLVSNEQQELARELRAGMRRRRRRATVAHRALRVDEGIIDLDVVASERKRETTGRSTSGCAGLRLDLSSDAVATEPAPCEQAAASTASSTGGTVEESPTKSFRNRVVALELERDQLRAALQVQVSLTIALQDDGTVCERVPDGDACNGVSGFEAYEAIEAAGEQAVDESFVDDGSSDSSDRTVIVSQISPGIGGRSLGRRPVNSFGGARLAETSQLISTNIASSWDKSQCPDEERLAPSKRAQLPAFPRKAEEQPPTLLSHSYGYQLYHISAIPLPAEEGVSLLSKRVAHPSSPFHRSVKNLLLW